jgi:hypothetical protein
VHIGLYTSMAGPYISQHQGGDGAALSMNRAAGPDWGIEGDWSGLLCNEQVAKPHRSDKPALKTSFRAGKRKKARGRRGWGWSFGIGITKKDIIIHRRKSPLGGLPLWLREVIGLHNRLHFVSMRPE